MRQRQSIWIKGMALALLAAVLISGCAVGKTTGGQANTPAPTSASGSAASSTTQNVPVTGKPGNPTKPVMLLETGSSLMYPLFNEWAPAIQQAYPNITIQTASTGSGTGIAQAISGVVQLGASDAYMSDAQLSKAQGIVNIPVAISAQQINYNLPGVKSLNLSGPTLAGIYTGKIQFWDDPAIMADNSSMNLPHNQIIPIHRTDGSGDTFLFTSYLSASDPNWKSSVGANTSVNWPSVSGSVGAQGNPGIVQTLSQTPYSIGYVGISFLDQATSKNLGTAALKNQAGNFEMPEQKNIAAAASAMIAKTPDDERISMIFAPGADSYPIINYEYVIVQTHQSDAVVAGAIRTALQWMISTNGGNMSSFLDKVHFLPLPQSVVPKSQAQINQIQ